MFDAKQKVIKTYLKIRDGKFFYDFKSNLDFVLA